ncbi:hypothetical protein J4558_05335 [Leptolyngbya sp. 15MV]|nr:hypothetical protein J4558_05335 [Leptolyngbya sp. 15MV]
MIAVLLLLAAAPEPASREAFIAAHVARHREEACGMHWVGNPTHAQCLAMLRREAEAAWDARATARP